MQGKERVRGSHPAPFPSPHLGYVEATSKLPSSMGVTTVVHIFITDFFSLNHRELEAKPIPYQFPTNCKHQWGGGRERESAPIASLSWRLGTLEKTPHFPSLIPFLNLPRLLKLPPQWHGQGSCTGQQADVPHTDS